MLAETDRPAALPDLGQSTAGIAAIAVRFHIAVTLALLIGGTGTGCARADTRGLTLAGSTSVQPFAEKWADAFRASHPGTSLHVQGGGSTAGVQAAISGAAQIGMSSRALSRDESARVTALPIARDGMAVVVHPSNPLTDLSLAQVRDIYSGTFRTWRQLGGPNARITVITREEGSGTRAAFEQLVMEGRWIASSALVQDSTGAVRQMVASDRFAIGYVSLGLVDDSVKALALGGVVASEANINADRYPLVRPFLFIVLGQPHGTARDFIDWIRGPEGRELTRREGLLPPKA